VHTYGWYLAKFTNDAKAKGATVFICSLFHATIWKDGKVEQVITVPVMGYGQNKLPETTVPILST